MPCIAAAMLAGSFRISSFGLDLRAAVIAFAFTNRTLRYGH